MQNSVVLSLWIKAVYLMTYLIQISLLGYLILFFLGKASFPLGVSSGETFELIGFCILLPLLCHFGLYCRNNFDLVRMCDGTSPISRFIWTVLVMSMNLVLLHIFLRDFLRVYKVVN